MDYFFTEVEQKEMLLVTSRNVYDSYPLVFEDVRKVHVQDEYMFVLTYQQITDMANSHMFQIRTDMQRESIIVKYGNTVIPCVKFDEEKALSFYAGARMNYVSNKYTGYLRNISAQINGNMVELNPFFSYNAQEAKRMASECELAAQQAELAGNAALAEQYRTAAGQAAAKAAGFETYASATADKELYCTQSGWGLTPILGADFRWGKLNVGTRLEFNTHLNIENDTRINTTGIKDFDHGVNTPSDLPGIFSLGAQYDVCSHLRVMAGYHYYFDKNAGMANNKQETLKHNTNEWLFGVEVPVCDRLLVSAGGQITNYGCSDAFQSDISFSCDSYSLGFGAKINVAPKVDINVAYFWTTYSSYNRSMDHYNGTPLPGSESFDRTNKVFGAGVNFSF